jgi:hypothetical protein
LSEDARGQRVAITRREDPHEGVDGLRDILKVRT